MQKKSPKWLLCGVLALLALLLTAPALAGSIECTVIRACKIFESPSKNSKVLATAKKGDRVTVSAVSGKWAQVKSGGNTGYMAKGALKKSSQSGGASSSGTAMQKLQSRLVSKGYLASSSANGKGNAATTKAIRIFQMMNGLKATGSANRATVKKLMSSGAQKRKAVNGAAWAKSGINTRFKDGGTASVIDLATGARLKIRRVGGHNHLDVEPKTAADTATLKRVYGGSWSWDSRPILLLAGGRYYAAAMNGMPHGAEISKNNNFNGQFCIHLKGSLTHGTQKLNSYHQANINKVIAYFS